jgi:hypothetical protein
MQSRCNIAQTAIPQSLVEAAKNDFLAGLSLREISAKHGYSLRSWAKYAKEGAWQAMRMPQQNSAHVATLSAAADSRAKSITNSWRAKIDPAIDVIMAQNDIIARICADRAQELTGASLLQLYTIQESNARTAAILAKAKERSPSAGAGGQIVINMLPSSAIPPMRSFREVIAQQGIEPASCCSRCLHYADCRGASDAEEIP